MRQLKRFQNGGFSRGAPAVKEACWWVLRFLLFSHGFPIPSPLKVAVLRLWGARIGTGVVIRSRVNITFPWRFACGDDVWIGDEVLILSLAEVNLGSNVCLSQRAFLCTGSHDHTKAAFDLITEPIVIEDGCWVGAQAFVGPGVILKQNTVCAAGAVVVKEAGPDELIGGNPAKLIRSLEQPS
jgi:putative colanic acid biosynthesis acetyltransferase WcaF